ncbi:hypothetical protein [Actinomadura algeriensis]|uniref:Uncharacterized protein n=1 Tax=Actinomadura algeriensis TaxID=1679523 RepID=A0ABR9JIB1_9ACTN|nr:hypothetical protein [Actinomadura algeriensis]MBE1530277.1 hypothetical protein [Actinomadura algeriensis]
MTMRRMVMTAGGAVLPVALMSLIFGNQWVAEAIREEAGPGFEGIWQLIYRLQTLAWLLYPDNGTNWAEVIVLDFGLILSLVLLAALAAVGVRAVDPKRGALGAVVTGWWACFVAACVGGFVTGVLVELVTDASEFHMIGGYVTEGAAFGFLYGWTAGLGALAGYHFTRDRGPGGQPMQQPYGQQPYQPQPGVPMQQQMPPMQGQQPMPGQPVPGQQPYQPQPYAPQHPAAVPYVPPQGGPQQPAWGGAPQQPPVPQQPPAVEPPAPSPAPDAPTLDPPTQEDDPEPAGDVPGGGVPGGDAQGGGDLADKTMLDHDPDEGDDRPASPPA